MLHYLSGFCLLLLSCTSAKYAPENVRAPEVDSGFNPASDTGVSPKDDTLVLRGIWDGDDGIKFEWNSIDGAAFDFTVQGPSDYHREWNDIVEYEVTLDGLETGEYRADLIAKIDSTDPPTQATLNQYVGLNRIVYQSELPLERAMDVWGTDTVAVIGGGKNPEVGVLVVDVSTPTEPEVIATLTDIGFVRDVKIFDDLLFTAVDPDSDGCTLCDDIGVRIFDFSDPREPILLSTIDSPAAWVHNMTYSDGYLYLASMMEEVVAIVDVRDPKNPTRVATWYADLPPFARALPGPGGGPHDMMAQGDRLYVAHVTGFSIVDISDPTHPSELASVRVDMGMHNVWPNADGSRMVGTQEIFDGPLTLWDISDLDDIKLLDSLSTGTDRCVHNGYFDGDDVLAAWYIDGIFSFDVASDRFVQTGHYDTFPGEVEPPPDGGLPPGPPIDGAWGLWSLGPHLIVGDTHRGMMIFDHFPKVISSQ